MGFRYRSRLNPSNTSGQDFCQQPPQFLFTVDERLGPPVLAITSQQIKCEETRGTTAEKQIPKLRLPLPVEADDFDDFAIEHSQFRIPYSSPDVFGKVCE